MMLVASSNFANNVISSSNWNHSFFPINKFVPPCSDEVLSAHQLWIYRVVTTSITLSSILCQYRGSIWVVVRRYAIFVLFLTVELTLDSLKNVLQLIYIYWEANAFHSRSLLLLAVEYALRNCKKPFWATER
jgi:hypothetical protein